MSDACPRMPPPRGIPTLAQLWLLSCLLTIRQSVFARTQSHVPSQSYKMTDIWNWAEKEIRRKGEVDSGTSIMAVEFDGGVIIGADSRTSTGSYVANRVSDKLTEVHDTIYCCRSGSAADTQAISDIVRYQLSSHGVSLGENRQPQVLTAANLFKKFC